MTGITVILVVAFTLIATYLIQRARSGWALYRQPGFAFRYRLRLPLLILTFILIPQAILAPTILETLRNNSIPAEANPGVEVALVSIGLLLVGMGGLAAAPLILGAINREETTSYRETPYDSPAILGDSDEKIFDVFVSYKSEDVSVVRQFVDSLIAGGARVWFAEYMILLEDRDQFKNLIDRGLRQSRCGLIFTNERYFGSEYCRYELEHLLKPEYCGTEGVNEVKLGNSTRLRNMYPQLAQVHSIEFESSNFRNIMGELRLTCWGFGVTGWEIYQEEDEPAETRTIFYDEQIGCHLDLTGWQMYYRGMRGLTNKGFIGPAFRRKVQGTWLGLHISAGVAATPRGNSGMAARFSTGAIKRALHAAQQRKNSPVATLNDRKVYDAAIDFANEWSAENHRKCAGVHLFFYGGSSHLALTYATHRGWNRRYSLVLSDPESGLSVELALVFKFMGRFSDYCRYTAYMDRVVQSLH